jgi:YVTN family beta-propeller protein
MSYRKYSFLFLAVILLAAGLGVQGGMRDFVGIADDADGDGVPDSVDACPAEDASFFDRDGDGCIDDPVSARHTEFWIEADMPFVYYIQEDGVSSVGDGSDLTAIQNGMGAWGAIPDVDFSVSYGGTIAQEDADAIDLVNMITFRDDEYPFPSGVLAVGISTSFTVDSTHNAVYYRPGQIIDADMIFNPAMSFSTPSSGVGLDIQSIATHEAGHLFGIAHSAVRTSTMFYVLPYGTTATTLEAEDIHAFFKAYGDSTALANANRIEGKVTHGQTGEGVPGAAVFAIDAAGGDTVACEYTFPDGSYSFVGLADGSYYVGIHPLDGTSSIGYLLPAYINALVDSTAEQLFLPEYWDLSESNSDEVNVHDAVAVSGGSSAINIDLITNIDSTAPSVVSITPVSSASGVLVNAAVKITFDEAIDYTTISGNFVLMDEDSNFISGSVAVLNDDSVLAFTPSSAFQFAKRYDLTIETGLQDKFGNGLATDYESNFITEPLPPIAITHLAPNKGVVGSIVVISGVGFSWGVNNNTVMFGTEVATVTYASPYRLVVLVPSGATTDLVTVNNGLETSAGLTFTVLSQDEIARGFQTGVTNLNGFPRSIEVTADGGYAYVALDVGAAAVAADPGLDDYLDVTHIGVVGGLEDLALRPDGKLAYGVSRLNEKIYVIDTDPAHIGFFNTVIYELDMDAGPLGIAIDPGGEKAYIPTDEDEIQVWDIHLGSETFNEQIGVIVPDETSLRGRLTVDPSGDKLIALTGTGRLLAFDIGPDTLLASFAVNVDPKDLVIDPAGQRVYVSGGDGDMTVVSLAGLFKVQDINTGGSLRGAAISPAGSYMYVANRELNLLDVIDLNEARSTFRSIVATVTQDPRPADIALSPDGFYAFSIVESSEQLVVTTIGLGPTLRSMSKRAGIPGAKIVLAGDGYGTEVADIDVRFAGPGGIPVLVRPESTTGTALVATVPTGAVSGPVDIVYDPPVEVPPGESPPSAQISNSLYFKILDPVSGPGHIRMAGKVELSESWSLQEAIAVTPEGDFMLVGGSTGELSVIDTEAGSPTFNRLLNTFRVAGDEVWDIAVTPDGERAFAAVPGDSVSIRAYSVNKYSGSYGKPVGEINFVNQGYVIDQIRRVQVSPSGELLVAFDNGVGVVYIIDIRAGSTTEYQVLTALDLTGCSSIAFHPSGSHAYVNNYSTRSIIVLDLDPLSGSYLTLGNSVLMPEYPDGYPPPAPIDMEFLPDGSECKVYTSCFDGIEYRTLVTLDTSDPANPVADPVVLFLDTSSRQSYDEGLAISPRGDRAIVEVAYSGYFNIDLSAYPDTVIDRRFDFSTLVGADFVYTPDGSRLYSTAVYPDSIFIYDFTDAAHMYINSGNLQTGVVGQLLPAPLQVYVANAQGYPVEGVPLTFNAEDGYFIGGYTTQVVATDANGYASVEWVLGDSEYIQLANVQAEGLVPSIETFEANGVADPGTLPLSVAQVLPFPFQNGVSITTGVQVTFNRPVDPSSVTSSTFFVHTGGVATPVTALNGYADSNRKVALIPSAPLDYNAFYLVEYTSGVQDTEGGALTTPGLSEFSTQAKPVMQITSISPPSATVGVKLMISGVGFETLASDHTVLFNDEEAVPYEAGAGYLKVKVPLDAIPGIVRVAAAGDTSNSLPFTVLVPSTSPVDEVIKTVGTGSSTKSVTVTPDGAIAYSVSPDGDVVIPIDINGETTYPSIAVGDNPIAIAMHPDGNYAYVANFGSGTVTVICVDPDSIGKFNTVVTTISVGTNPLDVAVHPNGDRIYVANAGSSNASVIDGDTGSGTHHSVVMTVGTGAAAKSVTVSPDGTRIFIGTDTGYVIVDPLTNGVTRTVGTGSSTKSVTVTPDGALLIVLTTEGEILLIDVQPGSSTENQVVAKVGTGSTTKSVTVSPDGALLYIILENSDYVIVYSIETLGSVGVLEPGISYPPPVIQVTLIDSILVGSSPADIAFDPSGSGTAIITNAGDMTVTILNASSVPAGPLSADVIVDPQTLNLDSKGRFVTGYIELPTAYFPSEIDETTVRLNDVLPAVLGKCEIVDNDLDGIEELVVKFDRVLFQSIISEGEYVPVTISGLARGRAFAGTDTIRVIRPTVTHPTSCVIQPGQPVTVTWTSPDGYEIDEVDIFWTPDDGETWNAIAEKIPDNGYTLWIAPESEHNECRVMVVLYDKGDILGIGLSPEPFIISFPVAVAISRFHGEADEGGVVLKWETSSEVNTTGFNLLRSVEEDGDYDLVTKEYVPAKGLASGAEYEYSDGEVSINTTYWYVLKEVSGEDSKLVFGPYKVIVKAPFSLSQNMPNPFNPVTTIRFTVPEDSDVNLTVYDVAGRRVKTLVNGHRKADFYRVIWEGTNNNGSRVASGVYFYRLTAGKNMMSTKMVLLR